MPRDLTDAAKANLAKGADTGPGTDHCRACGGPKSDKRLNSALCAECETTRKPAGLRAVETRVPAEIHAAAHARAAAEGTTLAAVLRDFLASWASPSPAWTEWTEWSGTELAAARLFLSESALKSPGERERFHKRYIGGSAALPASGKDHQAMTAWMHVAYRVLVALGETPPVPPRYQGDS